MQTEKSTYMQEQTSQKVGEELFLPPSDLLENPKKYEDEIPLLARTVGFVRQMERSRSKGREQLIDDMVSFLTKDPDNIVNVYRNLEIMQAASSEDDDRKDRFNKLKSDLQIRLKEKISHPKRPILWDPDKLERLFQHYLDSQDEIQALLRSVTTTMFNAPRTIAQSVNLQYNAAWAMVATKSPEVCEAILSVLCIETECLRPNSLAAQLAIRGPQSVDDDVLRKNYAIDDAIDFVCILTDEREHNIPGFTRNDSERAWQRVDRLLQGASTMNRQDAITVEQASNSEMAKDFIKYEKNMHYIMSDPDNGYQTPLPGISDRDYIDELRYYESISKGDWPYTVAHDDNEPLRKLAFSKIVPQIGHIQWEEQLKGYFLPQGYMRLTPQPVQLTDKYQLDIIARYCTTEEQRKKLVDEVCESLRTEKWQNKYRHPFKALDGLWALLALPRLSGVNAPFDKEFNIHFRLFPVGENVYGRLATLLEYHRPYITTAQAREIERAVVQVRTTIKNTFQRSVGVRGATVLIADSALKDLGYESITFKQNRERDEYNVKIVISGQEYTFSLDNNLRTIFTKDLQQYVTYQDQAWLELLALSHLQKIICIDEDIMKDEMVGGNQQYEKSYRRQTTERREHLRKQSPGCGYTQQAFEACLGSGLPERNLYIINKDRGATRETGMWTYVSGVETVDSVQQPPVKVAFKGCADIIRSIVPLDIVTDDELKRIENLILSDLLNT